jgi:beta-ribofuranosylaminobenzene 5'-phosphate synthase
MTRVVAPSRLHFGLLNLPVEGRDHWPGIDGRPGLPVRHFGGVGLMVDSPGLAVQVEAADGWAATGRLADRALKFARRFVGTLPPVERQAFRLTVEYARPEHQGLGVGTQLGLAVAKAIAVETGHCDWPAVELAGRVGRGERSAIGVHGFDGGGLIVEGGKRTGEAMAPLVARLSFPADWRVVVYDAPGEAAWHGGRERQAFAKLAEAGPSPAETEALCRIVLTGMLPALAAADLEGFGEALYEFNARAGDAFAPAQGGRYAGPAVAALVARLREMGVRGVGQSSWGPAVFAVTGSLAEAVDLHMATVPDVPAVIAGASAGAVVGGSPDPGWTGAS